MFTARQTKQLLSPINPVRVGRDPGGNSYVAQQDVLAHLTRVFGFGNWTTEILELRMLFETPRDETQKRWDVSYICTARLSVWEVDDKGERTGNVVFYENGSTGEAQNQRRAAGHDLAMKTAISTAIKRCAINLGDQFGLSLYNKGQLTGLVMGTLVNPKDIEMAEDDDVSEGVTEQVDAIDETVHAAPIEEPTEAQKELLANSLGAREVSA